MDIYTRILEARESLKTIRPTKPVGTLLKELIDMNGMYIPIPMKFVIQ
jgi:hypothetical protein